MAPKSDSSKNAAVQTETIAGSSEGRARRIDIVQAVREGFSKKRYRIKMEEAVR